MCRGCVYVHVYVYVCVCVFARLGFGLQTQLTFLVSRFTEDTSCFAMKYFSVHLALLSNSVRSSKGSVYTTSL